MADVLDILNQVFISKEPYASIAAKWGITTAYVSQMVKKASRSKEYLEKKQTKDEQKELKVEMVESAVETILVRDGVVKSAKQVSDHASQTFDQELKPWNVQRTLR